MQRLHVELLKVDWAAQLKSSLLEAEYTQVRRVDILRVRLVYAAEVTHDVP